MLTVYLAERDAAQASAAYSAAMLRDGYTTLLIDQSDSAPEDLTWANCSTLRHQRGARAVVGLREPALLRLWSATGPEVAVREAMGDVASFLSKTSPSRAELRSSPSLVFDIDALGARPANGSEAEFITKVFQDGRGGDTRVAISETLSSFGGGLSGNAIMLAPPGGEISTCVVLTDLDRRDQVETAAVGLFPVADGYGHQWALANADRFDSPRHRYERRASHLYWLGAVALISLTLTFGLWMLRGDLAVYSVSGLRTRQVLGLAVAEMLVVALGTVLITLGAITFDLTGHPEAGKSVAIGLREVARAAVASLGVCTSVAGAFASVISRQTLNALKER